MPYTLPVPHGRRFLSERPACRPPLRAAESAFLDLYRLLYAAPDPAPALVSGLEAASRAAELEAQARGSQALGLRPPLLPAQLLAGAGLRF